MAPLSSAGPDEIKTPASAIKRFLHSQFQGAEFFGNAVSHWHGGCASAHHWARTLQRFVIRCGQWHGRHHFCSSSRKVHKLGASALFAPPVASRRSNSYLAWAWSSASKNVLGLSEGAWTRPDLSAHLESAPLFAESKLPRHLDNKIPRKPTQKAPPSRV